MRVHFYIEANPMRAKMHKLENLKLYQFSSYAFYAFGMKNKFTQLLSIPQWYMKLGKNMLERQAKYRKLFREYLLEKGIDNLPFFTLFVGSKQWECKKEEDVAEYVREKKKESPADIS